MIKLVVTYGLCHTTHRRCFGLFFREQSCSLRVLDGNRRPTGEERPEKPLESWIYIYEKRSRLLVYLRQKATGGEGMKISAKITSNTFSSNKIIRQQNACVIRGLKNSATIPKLKQVSQSSDNSIKKYCFTTSL